MLLANYLDDLERVSGLGFGPFIALLIVFLAILAGVIATGFVFFWKQLGKAWAKRDEERQRWHKLVEDRLEKSEERHRQCEEDREVLRDEVATVKGDLGRIRRCPRANCPMRLP